MTEIHGIVVPEPTDLDELVEELGTHEPLMAFPSTGDVEEDWDWSSALDALIAAKLVHP